MPINWTNVFSSNVAAVGYDPDTKELVIQWMRGRSSTYENVPADVAEEASKAYSVGSYINENIKPNYKHRY